MRYQSLFGITGRKSPSIDIQLHASSTVNIFTLILDNAKRLIFFDAGNLELSDRLDYARKLQCSLPELALVSAWDKRIIQYLCAEESRIIGEFR